MARRRGDEVRRGTARGALRALTAAAAVATVAAVAGCGHSAGSLAGSLTGSSATASAPAGSAAAALSQLPIKGRAQLTGYSRERFGEAWTDVDHNGCDTRNDILHRDLRPTTVDRNGCTVLSGKLADPYTGQTIDFRRGNQTSPLVQIDHVVALANSWVTGAQGLSDAQRKALANDPLNLLAVSGAVNQAKKASDAATWLPPRSSYRCEYVARQIAVKLGYRLWVTKAEHDAMSRVLASCPAQQLPH